MDREDLKLIYEVGEGVVITKELLRFCILSYKFKKEREEEEQNLRTIVIENMIDALGGY